MVYFSPHPCLQMWRIKTQKVKATHLRAYCRVRDKTAPGLPHTSPRTTCPVGFNAPGSGSEWKGCRRRSPSLPPGADWAASQSKWGGPWQPSSSDKSISWGVSVGENEHNHALFPLSDDGKNKASQTDFTEGLKLTGRTSVLRGVPVTVLRAGVDMPALSSPPSKAAPTESQIWLTAPQSKRRS